MNSLRPIASFNFIRHQDIRSLTLCIPESRIIAALLVQILEIDHAVPVSAGTYVHDARVEGGSGGGEERGEQELEE